MESLTLDLMTFLFEQYKLDCNATPMDEAPSVNDFVRFAKNYLAKVNQPINVAYLPVGLGLRLQQGQIVGFAETQPDTSIMRDGGIPITRPQTIPGMGGVIPTESIPI